MTDAERRVSVVTGGTRGIGLACARALAEVGDAVVVVGRSSETADAVATELATTYAVPALGLDFDVADFASSAEAFKRVTKEFGRLDVLVANAGIMRDAVLGMIRPEDVERVLATNVAGTIASIQAAARAMMRRRSGAIVVLGSIVGERGSAGMVTYAASKAAVAGLAKSAAKELGPRGIRVNAVAPGLIETDLLAGFSAESLARHVANTPMGRLGCADDVARVVRFLVSDDAAFVTGQVVGIDGGLTL